MFCILLAIGGAAFCSETVQLLPEIIEAHPVQSNLGLNFVTQMNAHVYIDKADIDVSWGTVRLPSVYLPSHEGFPSWETSHATSSDYPSWKETFIFENVGDSFFRTLRFILYSNDGGGAFHSVAYHYPDFSSSYPMGLDDSAMIYYNGTMIAETNHASLTYGVVAVCTLTECNSRIPVSSTCSSDLDTINNRCYKVGSGCSLCSDTTCSSCSSLDSCVSASSSCVWSGSCKDSDSLSFCSSSSCFECNDSTMCGYVGCSWNSSSNSCSDMIIKSTVGGFLFLKIGVPIIFIVIVVLAIIGCCRCRARAATRRGDGYATGPAKVYLSSDPPQEHVQMGFTAAQAEVNPSANPPQQEVQMGYPAQQVQMEYPAQQVQMGYPAQQVQMGYPAQQVQMGYPAQQVQMGYPAQQVQMGYPAQQVQMGYPAQQVQGVSYPLLQ